MIIKTSSRAERNCFSAVDIHQECGDRAIKSPLVDYLAFTGVAAMGHTIQGQGSLSILFEHE